MFTKRTRFFRATMMWRVKIEKKKEKNLKPQRLALRASSLKILMVLPWKKWTNQTNVNASSFIRLFKWPETYLYLMRTSISTHHHHHRRRMPIIIHCSERARNPLRMVLLLFHVNWMRTRKKVWWKIEYFSRFVARKKKTKTYTIWYKTTLLCNYKKVFKKHYFSHSSVPFIIQDWHEQIAPRKERKVHLCWETTCSREEWIEEHKLNTIFVSSYSKQKQNKTKATNLRTWKNDFFVSVLKSQFEWIKKY